MTAVFRESSLFCGAWLHYIFVILAFREVIQMRLSLVAAALAVASSIGMANAQALAACEIAPFRGMTQPGGAQATMRVVNNGEPCRIRYLMRSEPQRVPFEQAQVSRAPANGTATATGDGAAYTPSPGFTGTDSFTVTTRGTWQGNTVNGQVAVTVTVLPRP